MREDNKSKIPSPTNKNDKLQSKPWFWPSVYAAIAVALIGLIFSYNALIGNNEQEQPVAVNNQPADENTVIETNAQVETMKFPFDETKLEQVSVLQDFYDITADEETREKALLVFNQTFSTSSGVSLSMNSEPFEVRAAMSGEVTEVKLDAFTGNQIIITHPNGMETRYSSVTDILVKEGDEVIQGQPLATTTDNEWNPTAGVHLHFQVLQDGEHVNPRDFLSF
ncbi:stage II sporulation protein [Ureibacillus massiliensis 4400831 = CIP 108448 = CCUG 49529]|uniref:Stage II sporulation protein n=1 Tax=Ureibacillus massiliensis 4400831 = CIP 108448 = CCUG 49529 TaxID=1211035 RepID=A0A0A3J6E6_9BACL|nr:M23 family metallopeptidase [Ureibacillus massiliensis]KGR92496.1 stage II sporulation protein [Ureibacillus massiliensis 4400831 = CIP 108448 = CCUG 49529]